MKILIHYQKLFLLLIILTKPIVNPYFPKKDDKYLIDDLRVLKDLRMFAPASLSIVYKELTKEDEEITD